MRLIGSDPDVQTLISRIKNKDLDLQPDFQRGEVWTDAKKRRLIDSILREWHIPPIHVILVADTAKEEVLDGQQRLVSIRDFANGVIRVDGHIEPYDENIRALHGRTYETLPPEWRRKFDRFAIRVFQIVDYRPEEPAELFYRLNQPANLTAPEQRNAFFGPARTQVRTLVHSFEEYGIDKQMIGFSNSRMAYDDVVSRLCFSLEVGTLSSKVTATELANRYRSNIPFSQSTFEQALRAIALFGESRPFIDTDTGIHLNKATLYSWLWFLTQVHRVDTPNVTGPHVGRFIAFFEWRRALSRHADRSALMLADHRTVLSGQFIDELLSIYNDRSSARVADVSSVVSRDIVTWILFLGYMSVEFSPISTHDPEIGQLLRLLDDRGPGFQRTDADSVIRMLIEDYQWGTAA